MNITSNATIQQIHVPLWGVFKCALVQESFLLNARALMNIRNMTSSCYRSQIWMQENDASRDTFCYYFFVLRKRWKCVSYVSCFLQSWFSGHIISGLCSNGGRYGNEPQLVKAGCCSNLNGQVPLVIQGRMLTPAGEGALECHAAVLISC